MNDKTIVKFDGLISAIHDGTRYANVEFDLCGSNGELIRERGLYVIVDAYSVPQSHLFLPIWHGPHG